MVNVSGFNADKVDPMMSFAPFPTGKYLLVITKSELKTTKAKKGQYIELTMKVLEGPLKNRNYWVRLNIKNPNPDAERMANSELGAICRAVKVTTPKDTAELHNIPFFADIVLKNKKGSDEMENKVDSYSPRNTDATTAPVQPQAGQPAQAAPVSDESPWDRK